MPDHFHEAVQALKDTADGLIVANTAIKRAADAVLAAREEYREREDSISHLESLVLQLSTEVRALRDRLNNGSVRPGRIVETTLPELSDTTGSAP